jgi:hypothetical protein
MESKFFLKALASKFESWELCELLDVSISDFIAAFEDLIWERQTDLEDELKYGH